MGNKSAKLSLPENISLNNVTAIVTGANRGIGYLLEQGMRCLRLGEAKALGRLKSLRTPAFYHIAQDRPGRAGKADQRYAVV